MKKVLVTGTAGFIGFHLARLLLEEGFEVCGFDGYTDYYDVSLKRYREHLLQQYADYSSVEGLLENDALLETSADLELR